jgi:Fe-S-cluster containining protein
MSTTQPVSDFACRCCGACCRISGYVRLTDQEVHVIADFLGMEETQFIELCTVPTADRPGLSLIENPDGACLFLRPDNSCDIAEVKPRQCREFPLGWAVEGVDEFCAGLTT